MSVRRGRPDAEPTRLAPQTFACRVMGHRWTFTVDGTEMLWSCDRGCGVGGRRVYDDAREARYFAAALNRRRPGPPRAFLKAMGGIAGRPKDMQDEHDRSRRDR